MKYLIFLLMFLISCNIKQPVPKDVLDELQGNRIFNLSGDIDWVIAKDFKRYTERLKAGDTVLMYIFSDGGEVNAGEDIIHQMAKFKTICIADKALSAAFEIYQHCTVRVYIDRTILMVHHHYMIFTETEAVTAPRMLLQGLDAYIQEASLLGRCAARMNMTYRELDEQIAKNGGDWYIYGSSIQKFNAADYHIKQSQFLKTTK